MSKKDNQKPVNVEGEAKAKGPVELDEEEQQPDVSMFGESSGLADAVLVVEGIRIPVIKAVLSIASPVLREKYRTATGEVPEAVLLGQSFKEVQLFLTWIYPDNCQALTWAIACNVLPTAHALQATSLLKRCETVLYEYVTTRFADGKEADTCKRVFSFLHLAEKCNLRTVVEFCVQVASEYSYNQRQEALICFPVSTDLNLKITSMAEQRLEILAEDDNVLIPKCCPKSWTLHDQIAAFEGQNESLRGLRLAFYHMPDNKSLISTFVNKVRKEMKKDKKWNTSFGHEYGLLPLKVKNYIKGRKVDEF